MSETSLINIDLLNGVDPKQVGRTSMALLTCLQNYRPEEQAAAVAVAFHLIRRQYNIHASKVLEVGLNLIENSKAYPEIRAAIAYMENEL